MSEEPQVNREVEVLSYPTASGRDLAIRSEGEVRVWLDPDDALDIAGSLVVTATDIKKGRIT